MMKNMRSGWCEQWKMHDAPASSRASETESVPGAPLAIAPDSVRARRGSRLVRWGAWFAFLLLVVGLALMPRRYIPEDMPNATDKIVHSLSFFWLCWQGAGLVRGRRAAWGVALACFLIGMLIEIIQPYVGRSFSYLDMTANGFGAVLGTLTGSRLADGRRESNGSPPDRANQ